MEGPVVKGDYVKIKGSGAVGKIVALKDKTAEVSIGSLKSKIKLDRLEKITRKEFKKLGGEESQNTATKIDLNDKIIQFYPVLDVRGKRAEEALSEVDHMIDSAILTNAREVKIIHGKGDGILRTVLRNYLKKHPNIDTLSDEHADRGGDGATLVGLK